MGTTPFRVFLDMKRDGKISMPNAKALVLAVALEPNGLVRARLTALKSQPRESRCPVL